MKKILYTVLLSILESNVIQNFLRQKIAQLILEEKQPQTKEEDATT